MSWSWQCETSDGVVVVDVEVDGIGTAFPTQSDAESWVGETWRELLAAGVDQVTLLEEERVVYGPMSLHPA